MGDRTGTRLMRLRVVIADAQSRSPQCRVTVVAPTHVQARMWERALATEEPESGSSLGLFGVRVVSWPFLAEELVEILGDSRLTSATGSEVVSAVAAVLVRVGDSMSPWLQLSADHPESWRRLAAAIERGAEFATGLDDNGLDADLSELGAVATETEVELAKSGLALAGRIAQLAAQLVGAADGDVLTRVVGEVLRVPGGVGSEVDLAEALSARGLLGATEPEEPQDGPALRPAHGDLVIVPDALAEARLAAHTVFGWLADKDAGLSVDDTVVIVPDHTSYGTLFSAELDRFGVPWWSPGTTGRMATTSAGRTAVALAQALDHRMPCLQCATGAEDHHCDGEFSAVTGVLSAMSDRDGAQRIVNTAQALSLSSGLANWMRLLRWLTGDDSQLAATSRWQHRLDQEWNLATAYTVKRRIERSRLSRCSPEDREFREVIAGVIKALDPASDDRLAERLQALAGLCDAEVATDLRTIADLLPAQIDEVTSAHDLLAPVLTTAVGERTGQPGDGVAVIPASEASAVTARAVVWSGLAEGLTPAAGQADPLVRGESDRLRRERERDRLRSRQVVVDADRILLTVPRVRIGTRATEVASPWVLEWTEATGLGAHEIVSDATPDDWRLAETWRPRTVDTGLEVLAETPAPASKAEEDGYSLAVAALVERVANETDTPGPDDGVLGPWAGEGDSWLASRTNADKPLSYSAVSDFLAYPRRFLWKQLTGIHVPDNPDVAEPIPLRVWGNIVHETVERAWKDLCLADPSERSAVLGRQITEQFEAVLPFVDVHGTQITGRVVEQATTVIRLVEGVDLNGESAWEREIPEFEGYLSGEIAGLRLHGFGDFVWPDAFIDLKTGRIPSGFKSLAVEGEELMAGAKLADANKTAKALQVGIYAGLGSQAGAGQVAGEFWYVKPGDSRRISLTMPAGPPTASDWRSRTLQQVKNGVDGGLFPAVGDPGGDRQGPCQYCDYVTLCSADTGERWARIEHDPVFRPIFPQPEPQQATGEGA